MAAAWQVAAGLALLGMALGLALWRSRAKRLKLEEALEAKSSVLENLQNSFARFAPDEVIEHVIASGVSSEGERKEVTALFADLVGFTSLSERTEPDVLVRLLNGYFQRMSRAITLHRGYVSTFVGDGILALFGALQPNPWQGDDAVRAALAMRAELADYNRELASQGLPTLSVGIGLHRGFGVAGLVGSSALMQYAFVGRVVNLAARTQDLTRQFEVDILLTQAVRESLDPRFELRELPASLVRGVAEPVAIYAAEGYREAP